MSSPAAATAPDARVQRRDLQAEQRLPAADRRRGPVPDRAAPTARSSERPLGAVGAVALALAVLCVVCVAAGAGAAAPTDAGSLQEEREVHVTPTLENGSEGEAPVATTDEGSITVVANVTTSAAVDPGLVQQQWSYSEAVDPDRVEVAAGGERLTYDLAAAEAGETLAFQVTASGPGDESDTDVLAVEVRDPNPEANAPNAELTYFDDPQTDTIERDSAGGTINFSAFETTDPNEDDADLSYEWQVSAGASGEVVGLSELSGEDYDADFFARYHVAPDDVGESFAVRLVVTNDRGLVDTDSITVRIDDDGNDFSTIERGAAEPPERDPAFGMSFVSAPQTVRPGEQVEVTVHVENAGEVPGTAALGLAFGGSDPAVRGVPLQAGESREVDVSFAAPPAPGEYDVTMLTQDIRRQHTFEVAIDESGAGEDGSAGSPDASDGDGGDASDPGDDAPQRSGSGATPGGDWAALEWAALLGAVFVLSLVGVGVRRVAG